MMLLTLWVDVALACDGAERTRLLDEANRLAARNAWAGVERAYVGLVGTGCDLRFDEHFLGAQASRHLGDTNQVYERLGAAAALERRPEWVEELAAIDASYGRVELKGDPRHRPVLSREAMPFAPDARLSIEFAMQVVANTGSFRGMLPTGDYVIGDRAFSVATGPDFQIVQVGKVKGAPTQDAGLVSWFGPIASLGAGWSTSPEPSAPVLDDAGVTQFSPSDVSGVGPALRLGAEFGLSYRKPALGLSASLGYGGVVGADTFHVPDAWLAGVLRTPRLRVALGPSFSVFAGRGTGVAEWVDVGQHTELNPASEIRYQGASWGPGVAGAVGMGVMDIGDALEGAIEVGGAWHNDGSRSLTQISIRLGIIPRVAHFEGG